MILKKSTAAKAELERVSLADVTARMKVRNLQMAGYLKSIGVALPEYYDDVKATPKRSAR